ncbi:hypothetical protein [Microbulbifer rhizosphaerae]|uniref:Uncharacterized protein n=1 Tax=Microbulbifer rhizosphaerae TaxID=1562603 RepID=A0A7W4ZBK7_9GAMM|nr:hypothetical protein [Microbulbifer rhizosphaerae]MBB3062410.1 hypothetical protein [Microbulbifer rhizosphaerae]
MSEWRDRQAFFGQAQQGFQILAIAEIFAAFSQEYYIAQVAIADSDIFLFSQGILEYPDQIISRNKMSAFLLACLKSRCVFCIHLLFSQNKIIKQGNLVQSIGTIIPGCHDLFPDIIQAFVLLLYCRDSREVSLSIRAVNTCGRDKPPTIATILNVSKACRLSVFAGIKVGLGLLV